MDWAGPGDQASPSGRSVYGKRPRDEPERLAPRDSLAWKPQCCGRILGRTVLCAEGHFRLKQMGRESAPLIRWCRHAAFGPRVRQNCQTQPSWAAFRLLSPIPVLVRSRTRGLGPRAFCTRNRGLVLAKAYLRRRQPTLRHASPNSPIPLHIPAFYFAFTL